MWNLSRRSWLSKAGYGMGGLALTQVLPGGGIFSVPAEAAEAAANFAADDPLAPKAPHFPPKIKSIIWLHVDGAPSSLDLYDYKPELVKLRGQEIPPSFLKGLKTSTQGGVGKLFEANRQWKQYGQSGAWFNELLPNLAEHADKMTFIISSVTIGATHDISIMKMNTSDINPGRPSLGSWITYALGSANPDLPPYVVLYAGKKEPTGGAVNWSSGFLPAVYAGTAFRPGPQPILNLQAPDAVSPQQQRDNLDLIKALNEHQALSRPEDSELQARIRSYELAYRMESSAPEAVDLTKETEATKELYGLNDDVTREYGTNLLRARRLVERGVRFVHVVTGPQEVSGDETNWDAHSNLVKNHAIHARVVDKPMAGLLADLKSRGLLEETLVVWVQEFGRTPYGESGDGRDHNAWGYTQWMAGGGIKPGITYGQTDELGLRAVENPVDTYDLQATVLRLVGLDFRKVTYARNGRSERPTQVYGQVIDGILA